MSANITVPDITHEAQGELEARQTLGFQGQPSSMITVGRSDVFEVTPSDVTADERFAQMLAASAPSQTLIKVTLNLSFRAAAGERFETGLLEVRLGPSIDDPAQRPVARVLEPQVLFSRPVTIQKSLNVGISSTDGLPVKATSGWSQTKSAEAAVPYVIAAGIGESDPEWRYNRTDTIELEGSHQMFLIADVPRGSEATAELWVSGTVRLGRRTIEAPCRLPPEFSLIKLCS